MLTSLGSIGLITDLGHDTQQARLPSLNEFRAISRSAKHPADTACSIAYWFNVRHESELSLSSAIDAADGAIPPLKTPPRPLARRWLIGCPSRTAFPP